MARATFSNIKHDDPELFVIKIAGHLGAGERKTVNELLEKCDEKSKTKVVFELSGLESLGGGVAKALGDFAQKRTKEGHPPLFVGASDTVRGFLIARFEEDAPSFCDELDQATAFFAGELPPARADAAEAKPKKTPSKKVPPVDETLPDDGHIIHLPDMSEAEIGARAVADDSDPSQPIQSKAKSKAGAKPRSSGKDLHILEFDRPSPDARYLSMDEAEKAFAAASDLAGMKGAVGALLYGVDLASVVHLMTRQGQALVEVGDASHQFPLNGALAEHLAAVRTPIPMCDLDDDMNEEEAELLTSLNCQMAVPVVVGEQLEGAIFVRKALAGSEYESAEVLALDLLARKLAHALSAGSLEAPEPAKSTKRTSKAGGTKSTPKGKAAEAKELNRKIHQQKALFNIAKEFNSTRDEDHLINLVLITTIAQVGVGHVAYFDLENDQLTPLKNRGLDDVELAVVPIPDRSELEELVNPVLLKGAKVSKGMKTAFNKLAKLGFETVAPVRGKEEMFGVLVLGPRLSGGSSADVDQEFLAILLNQAGVALENAVLFRDLHNRTLGVAQTFVNLIEKRGGPAARASTELITHYVGRVAHQVNYPSDHVRDLIYGTVLRDIGMIEISDLVLRSPRSLTPEEWTLIKQHPVTGVEILSAMDFSSIITDIVLYHHERFNGEGYPHGLRGAAIPLGARIVSAVEAFVAMTRDLPYRAALSRGEALEVMRENWGMRYDPEVLQAFLEIVELEGDQEPAVSNLMGVN